MKRIHGFTYVELMVSLAIMAVLLSVAVPTAQHVAQRQREHELREALASIRAAIDAYKLAGEQKRIAVSAGESGYPKSLQQLVKSVDDQQSPTRQKIYFLRRIPRDPMVEVGGEATESSWGLRSYASPAEQPRSGEDVFDVYSSSELVGLNGVAYRDW